MLSQCEWLSCFVSELVDLTDGGLSQEGRMVRAVGLQQWERLRDENPRLVAQHWAARSGLIGHAVPASPPSMLIWLSECSEELQRQQPFLGRRVVEAIALLQWDMHGELEPAEAALHWLANRPAHPTHVPVSAY